MTVRNTHPVPADIPEYNFPRSHYQTPENMKRFRKVKTTRSGTVNRRGLSVLEKALIVRQRPAVMRATITKKERKRRAS